MDATFHTPNFELMAKDMGITMEELLKGDYEAVFNTANHFRNIIVQELKQPGKGRTYEFEWRTVKGGKITNAAGEAMHPVSTELMGNPIPMVPGPHTASREGDPPATHKGTLAGAIRVEMSRTPKAIKGGVGVGSEAPYWSYLEEGTYSFGPRPFIRPAKEKALKGATKPFLAGMKAKVKKFLAGRRKR
jgi:HK97 gp10 family phage protein